MTTIESVRQSVDESRDFLMDTMLEHAEGPESPEWVDAMFDAYEMLGKAQARLGVAEFLGNNDLGGAL